MQRHALPPRRPWLLQGSRLLLALAAAAAVLPPAVAVYSSLWGKEGELWDPAGALPDFSFAGKSIGAADGRVALR